MPVRVQFSLEGETQIDRVLGIAAEGISDFSEPLKASKALILDRVEQNFDKRGTLFGGWKPRTKPYPWPLLEKSGKMRGKFYGEIEGSTLTVGNKADYFKYHQSNKPRKKIPRRVMLMIDKTTAEGIVKAFQLYIVKVTRGNK